MTANIFTTVHYNLVYILALSVIDDLMCKHKLKLVFILTLLFNSTIPMYKYLIHQLINGIRFFGNPSILHSHFSVI